MSQIGAISVRPATGIPFVQGHDPRRVINPPNNKGKKYETRKKLLRRYLDLSGGEHEGEQINQLERIVIRRIQAALGTRTVEVEGQNMTLPVESAEERFAAQYILDSLFGKPEQPIKQSGTLDINATITVEKLDAEAAIIQDRLKRYAEGKLTEEQYEREMRGEVQEAVFEDVSEVQLETVTSSSGESESETA